MEKFIRKIVLSVGVLFFLLMSLVLFGQVKDEDKPKEPATKLEAFIVTREMGSGL